ncbi:concanavalin A-like lectin/glucanase [Delitschia confertaspora ATCC 74209]|uniref:Concanavalin A-like lectin/glucanase n=1 Tax=Delitschia confertaspora ATCC 74209 TaxID=1513339 RepID=A0A9P4MNM0_9PLEO|nr:concanavalin A-like lectin/glucanase [Delitschia confertaspora ATCC 74209]
MLSLLPLATLLLLQTALAEEQNPSTLHDNSANCTCYVIDSGPSSSTPSYFLYHRFWDFRNIPLPSPKSYLSAPPLVTNFEEAASQAVPDPEVFDSQAWNTDWAIQNWSKDATEDFPVRMVNSPANVYISRSDESDSRENGTTYLTLRTSRQKSFQSAAEIESTQKNLQLSSLRIRIRVRGSAGAVAGFFTFADDANESDIEILTSDPSSTIRYTNQPSVNKKTGDAIPESSISASNLSDWREWHDHRIDWLEHESFWWLDGRMTASNTYSVPRRPSGLVLNMWGDGGEWSGDMGVGGSAELMVEWVEMVFNTSGPVEGGGLEKRKKRKGCEVVCKIDGVKEVGRPEVVSVNRSMAPKGSVPCVGLWVAGIVTLFLVGL